MFILIERSGMVTLHFSNNRSLTSLNNVKVPSSMRYSPSKGTDLLTSLEKQMGFVQKKSLGWLFFCEKFRSQRNVSILYHCAALGQPRSHRVTTSKKAKPDPKCTCWPSSLLSLLTGLTPWQDQTQSPTSPPRSSGLSLVLTQCDSL